jgi:hypothetical protein
MAGFASAAGRAGDHIPVIYRELIGPVRDLHLLSRLEAFQRHIFTQIPDLPRPGLIDHLLVIIRPDLSGTAYVNNMSMIAEVRTTRAVEKQAPVFMSDISTIRSVDLGIEIPDDAGFIHVCSHGWARSLFYDLGPLIPDAGNRIYDVKAAFAQQLLLLMGLLPEQPNSRSGGFETRFSDMSRGFEKLCQLFEENCEEERQYQELFIEHPWIFGGEYRSIERHTRLDDKRIPDFTGVRCYDNFHDIIEIKQPFLQCFKKNDDFASGFNDAWNQVEGYLTAVSRHWSYYLDEQGLRFENPRCRLIIGKDLTPEQQRKFRDRESKSIAISLYTYDDILSLARHTLQLMKEASTAVFPFTC